MAIPLAYVKAREGGRIISRALIVVVAVNSEGKREVLGAAAGSSEAVQRGSDAQCACLCLGPSSAPLEEIEAAILAWHKDNETSRRLATIPGIGPITASAIVATVTNPSQFHSARHFAAWIGLVPKQNSSGGKQRQGGISKQGDRSLRRLLVLDATAVIRHARRKSTPEVAWLKGILERRPARLASVAQANKTARIVWALLARGGSYRVPAGVQAASA